MYVRGPLNHPKLLFIILPVFRNQPLDIHEQLELARYFGPLHKHATTPVPREPGLQEVHGQSPSSFIHYVCSNPHCVLSGVQRRREQATGPGGLL
jgi:hypothetical protein